MAVGFDSRRLAQGEDKPDLHNGQVLTRETRNQPNKPYKHNTTSQAATRGCQISTQGRLSTRQFMRSVLARLT